jgi:hypothetical protein
MPGRLIIRAKVQVIRDKDSARVLICPVSIMSLYRDSVSRSSFSGLYVISNSWYGLISDIGKMLWSVLIVS